MRSNMSQRHKDVSKKTKMKLQKQKRKQLQLKIPLIKWLKMHKENGLKNDQSNEKYLKVEAEFKEK